MRNQLDKAIRRVMAARHAEHRRAAVLVILALLTILSVSWRLHQVGIAMTDDEYSCGYEEHVHSDACYTEVLICGYEDGASETPADSAEEDGETAPAAHSHTADCYQRVLTCTLPEHTHTLECLADITADVETPADWDEQSEGVSSFWSDTMTEIAQRQLGYTESAKNFTVDKALGESVRSYMAEVLADLRDYAADFSPATRESLLLVGNAGLGKTHAALAIAGEVLRQNYDVIYVSCPDFFGKLEALHFGTDPGGEEETLFQTACNADLLILDDLGTEFNSSFFLTNLYSLLNNRLGAKLPTIVTTNITDGALLEKLYTEKISSRLAAFVQIQFLGSDIRVQKAAE